MPDVASAPENEKATGRLYHPFTSGTRSAVAVTAGAVLSSLILTLGLLVPPSLVALHVTHVPGVSVVNVCVWQPTVLKMIDSGSTTCQLSVTLPLYQPVEGKAGE